MEKILESWKKRDIKPKFHVNKDKDVGKDIIDFVEEIPDYLAAIPKKYNTNIDIMIEAKKKEKAIKII